jgi:hypothetical protein
MLMGGADFALGVLPEINTKSMVGYEVSRERRHQTCHFQAFFRPQEVAKVVLYGEPVCLSPIEQPRNFQASILGALDMSMQTLAIICSQSHRKLS